MRQPSTRGEKSRTGPMDAALLELVESSARTRRAARGLHHAGPPMTCSPSPRFFVSAPSCDATCSRSDEGCSFQVAWVINVLMQLGAVNATEAVREHRGFVKALTAAGATVTALPFVHGAFDSVFGKDNAIVVERPNGVVEALLAMPRHAERRLEQAARRDALEAHGITVSSAARPLEGGDVVMLPHARGAFVGHGFRSSLAAVDELARFLEGPVTPLELRDGRLYHLDMALAVLSDGTALVCEEALTDSSLRAVRGHPSVSSVVRVPIEEALAFGANLVEVGDSIVWGARAPHTQVALEGRGYTVHTVPLAQFHLAGGSAACLVSRIHRQASRVRVVDTRAEPSVAA